MFLSNFAAGNWASTTMVLTYGTIIAPISEEVLFRGVIHRWLSRRLGRIEGVVLSGVLFGLIHASVLAFVPIALFGMLLALVLERTGSLSSCIALHAIFNAGQFALMALGVG